MSQMPAYVQLYFLRLPLRLTFYLVLGIAPVSLFYVLVELYLPLFV